ncbi:MAG: phage tail protein, partial [Halioglobus sp.]|nr:phage tail protein [Halioglobus sp.]
HPLPATSEAPNTNSPAGAVPAMAPIYEAGESGTVAMAPQAIANGGGGQAHNNLQPFLSMNFTIALVGLYPTRN